MAPKLKKVASKGKRKASSSSNATVTTTSGVAQTRYGGVPRMPRWEEHRAAISEEVPQEGSEAYEELYEGLGDFPGTEFQAPYGLTRFPPYRETETTKELVQARPLLEQLRGPIVDRLWMLAFAPDLLILLKYLREVDVGTSNEDVAKKARNDGVATTGEAGESHAIPNPEPSSGVIPPIVMTPSTAEVKDIQPIIPEGVTEATIIDSSKDEEGEKEDADHPAGSDATVDDAFWDNDEDGSAFLPREPALEVTTSVSVVMTPEAVDQWTNMLTSVLPTKEVLFRGEEAPIPGEASLQEEEASIREEASFHEEEALMQEEASTQVEEAPTQEEVPTQGEGFPIQEEVSPQMIVTDSPPTTMTVEPAAVHTLTETTIIAVGPSVSTTSISTPAKVAMCSLNLSIKFSTS
ncbi:uncharacterized protein A4U43_C01F15210 [Asparagus officinalis]|uniref:Uncharacterized protein n=1 Tax=Asparagus officinalis TaxID=4686 RepID=A0A5P1FPH4_ASPOF|nr:uncharacterized protein A4U43_C01F15210 [Asparagus officinalis]